MAADEPFRLTVLQRHEARRRVYWHAVLWAVATGLTSSTLVIYLVFGLNAPRMALGVALIKAAPNLAGLLRLGTPALIRWFGDRKRFSTGSYFLSGLVLLLLPVAAAPGLLPSAWKSLWAVVVLWCLYHLLEYLGSVALWSWLGDLVPVRTRGRFLGRRERWMVAGQAAAMLAAGAFNYGWRQIHPDAPWAGYAIPAAAGACSLMASVVFLIRVPHPRAGSATAAAAIGFSRLLAPFADRRFRRLLYFGCWFSFFNGVTQSPQEMYPVQILGITLFTSLALRTGTRVGQFAVSPWLGRLADRFGNRPVMIASWPIAASGLFFYLLATPQQWMWLVGAWAAWIAYAGLNVCLPNLMLKLSPGADRTAYVAAYYTASGLCVAASTILGGAAFDFLRRERFVFWDGLFVLDCYQWMFLLGLITRLMGVAWLFLILEPREDDRRH